MLTFGHVIGAVFTGLMLWAALSDLRSYRIPNAIPVTLSVLFVIVAVVNKGPWTAHLVAGAVTFLVCLVAYRFDMLGGGDVKLLAAVALWAGQDWTYFLLSLSLASLTFTLAVLIAREATSTFDADTLAEAGVSPHRVFQKGEKLPFAVPIALSALAVIALSPWAGWA